MSERGNKTCSLIGDVEFGGEDVEDRVGVVEIRYCEHGCETEEDHEWPGEFGWLGGIVLEMGGGVVDDMPYS